MTIHYDATDIHQAMRDLSKDALHYMITQPRDKPYHPEKGSKDYEMALEAMENYILHASYVIDLWRGKPKGTTMMIMTECIEVQNYQYLALYYTACGLANIIKTHGLVFEYYITDPEMAFCGSGYPDFRQTGEGARVSTQWAIDMALEQIVDR
jgi:hypothetical protein